MTASLKSHSQDGTLILTISNPQQHNALGPEIYAAGVEAVTAAESNPEVRSIILTGEGRVFSAGGNVKRLQAAREGQMQVQRQTLESLSSWVDAIRTSAKPVIAAVEGPAVGAAFALVLACDFLLAAEDAYFFMAHSKIGLTPDGGGSWQLARALPRPLATDALMRGSRLSAALLHQYGLVNQICSPGQALTSALALAADLNQRPSNVLGGIKELINDAEQQPLSAHLVQEGQAFLRHLGHENAGEGIAAFLEKRPPHFR
ncbi:MAG: enoyl-CoA hydratase [Betaproteobacteria bacterium]|nr:enoyl-CoA hydratase [Betaproteobacteria bacterium]